MSVHGPSHPQSSVAGSGESAGEEEGDMYAVHGGTGQYHR